MIAIKVSVTKLFDSLPVVGKEQLPFGLAVGLNKTGKDIQAAQRRGMQARFTLRRPSFVLGMVTIRDDDWATKRSLVQRVRIGNDEPKSKAIFSSQLSRHEEGGVQIGDQWIPTGALRPSMSQLVDQRMRPYFLGLWNTLGGIGSAPTLRGGVRATETQRRGKQRTFSIINRQGELVGIYQRFGLKQRMARRLTKKGIDVTRMDAGIRLIWRHQQSIRLPHRLGFGDTARLVTRTRLMPNVMEGLARAVRTAKP